MKLGVTAYGKSSGRNICSSIRLCLLKMLVNVNFVRNQKALVSKTRAFKDQPMTVQSVQFLIDHLPIIGLLILLRVCQKVKPHLHGKLVMQF